MGRDIEDQRDPDDIYNDRDGTPYYGVNDDSELTTVTPPQVNRFLTGLPQEHRFAVLVDLVPRWGALGADEALFAALREVSGL